MTDDFRWGNLPPDVPQTPYNRLKAALPFIRVAVEAAKHEVPDGEIGLGILVTRPDGSVKFTAAMSAENFASDLEEVLADSTKVRCVRCDGNGYGMQFANAEGECPDCHGTGVVRA